jgi:CheY-like chemotaxis protein
MNDKIRILLVEDAAADAELIKHALHEAGLVFHCQRVDTRADFLHELQHHPPDVILSDHGLPTFDGFAAVAVARERCPDTPFIFVTGALGEEVAIASFQHGATDYVLKDRLSYLAPAIQRALREREERTARKRLEAERDELIHELKEALAQIKTLSGLLPICALCKKIRDHQRGWQPMEVYLQKHSDATLTHELCPECALKISPVVSMGESLQPGPTAGA